MLQETTRGASSTTVTRACASSVTQRLWHPKREATRGTVVLPAAVAEMGKATKEKSDGAGPHDRTAVLEAVNEERIDDAWRLIKDGAPWLDVRDLVSAASRRVTPARVTADG